MEVVDPFEELTGQDLRDVIERCLEGPGRISIGYHGGQDRMVERRVTGGQIIAALRGALRTDCCVAGNGGTSDERTTLKSASRLRLMMTASC